MPYGQALSRLAELRTFGPSRNRLRALQPYVVNLYSNQLKALEQAGAVELMAEMVRAIITPSYSHLYSDRFGLQTEAPFQADPASLITGSDL